MFAVPRCFAYANSGPLFLDRFLVSSHRVFAIFVFTFLRKSAREVPVTQQSKRVRKAQRGCLRESIEACLEFRTG